MAKSIKEILESYDFNRAAIAKQRLQNLRHAGRRVRGASIANLMRSAGLREEELDEEDLDQLDEVLNKDAKASDWIHDFVHSTNPKFEGKSKKERIKMALGAYYGKQNEEVVSEDKDTVVKDKSGKLISFKHEGEWKKTNPKKNPEGKVHNLAGQALKKMQQLSKEEVELDEAQYAGLEKEDKPGKIKTAVVKTHEKAVGSETVEGWKDAKKPVKESYDEEGNVTTMAKTYQEFMEGMIATKVAPNVTRYTGGSYGNAKGAKYGNTDYDKETLETKDDEGSEEQKRGRGRPAGSKSGARGPRIK